MSPLDIALQLLRTVAFWFGVAYVWRGAYLAFRGLGANPPLGVAFRSLAFGAALLTASCLLANAAKSNVLAAPLVWWIAPFWAWTSVAGIGGALFRLFAGAYALNEAERLATIQRAWGWAALGVVSLWMWSKDQFSGQVISGAIQLSALGAIELLALGIIAAFAMGLAHRSARANQRLRGGATQVALIVGSVLFGLPFFWLVLTSLKEDRDMAAAEGLIWIPKQTETTPVIDPDQPLIEGLIGSVRVEGIVAQRNPDGTAVIDVMRPGSMRGQTAVVKPPFKLLPMPKPVVSLDVDGVIAKGYVVEQREDGSQSVHLIAPANLNGRVIEAAPGAAQAVRRFGLKFDNYAQALEYLPVETVMGLVYVKNSLILVGLSVIGTLLGSSIAAYAFARLSFPNKNVLFGLLLGTMALPAAVTALPTFLIFRTLGWIDTLAPLWAPAFLGSAFNIFLLRQFYGSIPAEYEDAAKIDGCSHFRTYWTVLTPQIRPALAFVAVTTAMGAWNNFMGPLIYVASPEKMPVAYAMQMFQSDRVSEPGLLMAFAAMATLPMILLFFSTQKFFVEGVSLSGFGGR